MSKVSNSSTMNAETTAGENTRSDTTSKRIVRTYSFDNYPYGKPKETVTRTDTTTTNQANRTKDSTYLTNNVQGKIIDIKVID